MKVVITGSTGMIGKGVLYECLEASHITQVVLVNRTPIQISHPKITEVMCSDWFDLSPIESHLTDVDACFFCLGATATTMSEKVFYRVTYELTMHVAQTMAALNPNLVLTYVSGMGTDGTTDSKTMWVRIKGQTEQALLQLPIKGAYMFRPGYIQPMKGVRSKTTLYRWFYYLCSPFYPLLKRGFPRYVTSTVEIGRAMIRVAQYGYSTAFLENPDINTLAEEAS